MQVEIPSDLTPFVERLVAERRFLTAGDVLSEGLRLLQAREALKDAVQLGFQQLDAGEGIDATEVYRRAEAEIAAIAKGRT